LNLRRREPRFLARQLSCNSIRALARNEWNMDERTLTQNLAEELIDGWDIMSTGSGFLIITDWHWPNDDRIEIYVRTVGDREDLYIVTDGGNLFNFLFSHGIDLNKDHHGMKVLSGIAENCGAKIVDYQMARGANDGDLHRAIRLLLEAIKDASFLLWHKLEHGEGCLH